MVLPIGMKRRDISVSFLEIEATTLTYATTWPMRITLFVIPIFFLATSCVPQRQYSELKKENQRMSRMLGISDSTATGKQAAALPLADENGALSLEEEYAVILRQNEQLRATNINLNKSYQELLERYDRLMKSNDDISAANPQQLTRSGNDDAYVRQLEGEMRQKEERLRFLEQNYDRDISTRDQQIVQLQNELFRRDRELQQMRNALTDVQARFPATDLDISEKDGRLYVSLSQELLFRSGSSRLDNDGRDVIRQIAEAMRGLPDVRIMVEGHTDDQGNADRNWELSLDRALSVTQALTDFGISPERIVAAGRGEYAPRASNTTDNGRALNRRTEIILSPSTVIGGGQ